MRLNTKRISHAVCGTLYLTIAQPTNALSPSSAESQSLSLSGLRRIFSRDGQNTTTIPAPVSVSPSQYWDGNDGPWSSFAFQVGYPVQNIRLFPGTAATTTWTIGPDGCPSTFPSDCDDLRGKTYNHNASYSYTPNSIYDIHTELNLGLNTVGEVGFDDITLGWQGTGGPKAVHTIVFSLNPIKFWVGILGIDPRPTNFSRYDSPQPSLLQILVNSNEIPSLSYGYTAGNQYRLNKVYGSLTLGGYDQNRFVPTNITFPFYEDISRDLSVNLQAITTDIGSGSNLLPSGGINILIDSTIAELWLPLSACTAFEQAFGIVWDNATQYYVVNSTLRNTLLAQNPNVTFTIGPEIQGGPTLDIVLPYGAFDLQLAYPNNLYTNSSYYFPLKRAANNTQYTLGRTFLQEAYLIADYDRQNFTIAPCTWNQTLVQASNLVPILRTNETSHGDNHDLSSGAIAGVAIAVVVAVLSVAAAAFFLIRRHRQRKARAVEEQLAAEKLGEGYKPFLHGTEIVEVSGHSVSELDAPRKNLDPNIRGYSEVDGNSQTSLNKTYASEMTGTIPLFEMPGSDVHEMPVPDTPRDKK